MLSIEKFEDLRKKTEKELQELNYRVSKITDITVVGLEDSYGLKFLVTKGVFRKAVAEVLSPRERNGLELNLFFNRENTATLDAIEQILTQNAPNVKVNKTRKTNCLYEQIFLYRYD